MSRTNPFAATPPPRQPIVRRPAPAPRSSPPAPNALRAPRSLHWQVRLAELRLGQDTHAQMQAISDSSAELAQHVQVAVERGAPHESPVTLTPAAFSLIADVRQLGDWLFDKRQVDARTALDKLTRPDNLRQRDAIVARLGEAGLPRAQQLVLAATDASDFRAFIDAPQAPEVYQELQERGALLLAAEWAIAHQASALAVDDWPPTARQTKAQRASRTK